MNFWGQKTFCVVAGASKGIGQGIAQTFAKLVGPGSVMVLLSRTKAGLENTRSMILQNPGNTCQVVVHPIDLSSPNAEEFAKAVQAGFEETSTRAKSFSQFILVQVAASFDSRYLAEIKDVPYIRSYFDFNIASFILLNSVFTEATEGGKAFIVHITSHGAVTPYKTWGLYCAARAAKDMLLRSIALETPRIQTLNYAPGLVETDNYTEAVQFTKDPELVKLFEEERAKGLLTPVATAEKLAKILASQKWVKGEHVSYSDFEV